MVTKRPRQFIDMPENFDPIRSSKQLTTRSPSQPPMPEQPRPKYEPPPPQRDYDQNTRNFDFNERDFSYNDSTTMFPFPALSQVSFNNTSGYDHLRIEWTEAETKYEYIARYNRQQNGLWMASAPNRNLIDIIWIIQKGNNDFCLDFRISLVRIAQLPSQCRNNRSDCF